MITVEQAREITQLSDKIRQLDESIRDVRATKTARVMLGRDMGRGYAEFGQYRDLPPVVVSTVVESLVRSLAVAREGHVRRLRQLGVTLP